MNTLVFSGMGIHCAAETAQACRLAGGERVDVWPIQRLYHQGIALEDYGLLIFPGGFLDGDQLGGGRACANRFRDRRFSDGYSFRDRLEQFLGRGGLILGICNGFQLLVQLGFLPESPDTREQAPGVPENGAKALRERRVSLAPNARARYENRWVQLWVDEESACVFTRGLKTLCLPVRHGEGRLVFSSPAVAKELLARHQIPLRYALKGEPTGEYPANPNGSFLGAAALSNPEGTVLGLMPHPEAFHDPLHHPQWTRLGKETIQAEGLRLFQNAYACLREGASVAQGIRGGGRPAAER